MGGDGSGSSSKGANLEMLLALERAKVLQQQTSATAGSNAAAALKAFTDIQGKAFNLEKTV